MEADIIRKVYTFLAPTLIGREIAVAGSDCILAPYLKVEVRQH